MALRGVTLSQMIIGALIAVLIAAFGPRQEADAVSSDRDHLIERCERAMHELRAQTRGHHSSSFAAASLNQRTMSHCADKGMLPEDGTIL